MREKNWSTQESCFAVGSRIGEVPLKWGGEREKGRGGVVGERRGEEKFLSAQGAHIVNGFFWGNFYRHLRAYGPQARRR